MMRRPAIPYCETCANARFWLHVDKAGDCWLWTGSRRPAGYGSVTRGKVALHAHRVSWEIANGRSVPVGLQVLHRCDVRLCVRPDHLFLGTAADNVADKVAKGRQHRGSGVGRLVPTEV